MTAPALSGFELMVNALVAKGFKREVAISEVAAQYPHLAPTIDEPRSAELRRVNVLEKEEQAFIAKLFRGFGCKVYNLSQARATKQTPGLPDLWVIHRAAKLAWWFECKRAWGGKLSDAQADFLGECHDAGVRIVVGDRRAAAKLLVDVGLARPGDGPCGIVPFHEGRP